MKKSRTASAPWRRTTTMGSTTLPTCLDIFWPVSSSTRSFTTTVRYGAASALVPPAPMLFGSASPNPAAIASSE